MPRIGFLVDDADAKHSMANRFSGLQPGKTVLG